MNEGQAGAAPRRRTPAEAAQLVKEYEASGLSKAEFSRSHGLAVSTLDAYRRGRRLAQVEASGEARWVAVEMARPQEPKTTATTLTLVLAKGRRVEVGRGFDAATLERLLTVLERA